MKKIILVFSLVLMAGEGFAQHKTLTLYYPNDSTSVISISNLDSMSIFICGVSKVSYGGKEYSTVLIGDQCWLKENLDIGTMINSATNSTNNSTIEKYCYENEPANCVTYGGLYQWQELMQYSSTEGAQGICPNGWHIPTQAEIESLILAVDGNGNSLKAINQGNGSGAGTDEFGFSALLAGNKESGSSFIHLMMRGHFWSSSLSDGNVYRIYLWDDRSDISSHPAPYGTYGFCVRCIKD